VYTVTVPRVSVVLPVFNRASTISGAIAGVVAQTLTDWELVVVDDGSTDNLEAAVASAADPRLRLLRHEGNRGAAAARNTGIKAARAPLIAFIDSDDEWLPTKLARQIDAIERGPPSLGALCTAFRLRRTRTGYAEDRYPRARGTWAATLLDGCFVSPGSTLLARRECFETVGLLDEGLGRFEDWDWLLRLVERYAFDCLQEVLAVIHVGAPPSPETIATATRALAARHTRRIRATAGALAERRFRASLKLEHAAAAAFAGKRMAAGAAFAQAALLSPSRAMAFIGRGLGRVRAGDL
jgi:glycosyltransferase involved in cell wall biosynthesis